VTETIGTLLFTSIITQSMKPEFRKVSTPEEMEAAKSVRFSVFVHEQGVPCQIEMDEHDADATHVICLIDGKVVGTGRLVRMPDGMKLGRVAVLAEYRKRGLGAELVKWLLDRAMKDGQELVYANVQIEARGFYHKMGFKSVGEHFDEAGIEHVKMAWNKKT
jgi:predicted GNAT family N-acyltransferase